MAEPPATARKPRAEVRIAPTTYDDLPNISACRMLAFSGGFPPYDALSKLMNPTRAALARTGVHPRYWPGFASMVREHVQHMRDGQIMFTAFVKDENGNEVVAGMVRMTPPKEILEAVRQERNWKDRVLGDVVYPVMENVRKKLWKESDGVDARLLTIFKKELVVTRWRVDPEQRYFLINMLLTHPSFQGKGVGAALLAKCCSIADAEGFTVMLESTEAGKPLYSSRGFVEVDAVDFTYAGKRIMLPAMVRQPIPPPVPKKDGKFSTDMNSSTPVSEA